MIPIRNIFHMLAYAFQKLKGDGYVWCAAEEFDHVLDILTALLIKRINSQIKTGLEKDYRNVTESTNEIRGKINITDSIKGKTIHRQELVCEYDIFDENSYRNRILKTTMQLLVKQEIKSQFKQELRKLLLFFQNIDTIPHQRINWLQQYNRHNQAYQQLITLCRFIIEGFLQTQTDGSIKMQKMLDEQSMSRLYEKFILNYFKREHPEIQTTSEQIPWALTNERNILLPIMQSDVVLRNGNKTLIIDAKYYERNLQSRYMDSIKLHNNNLYQIYTYVDNYQKLHPNEKVSGMLLYAQTSNSVQPNTIVKLQGIELAARTLNLDLEFQDIASQLDDIARAMLS